MRYGNSNHSGLNAGMMILGGIVAGAAIMYMLDPALGRGRRAYLAQKGKRIARKSGEYLAGKSKDLSNRARGLYYETRKAITGEAHASAGV